jgi:ATP phosphoribosyltransferase
VALKMNAPEVRLKEIIALLPSLHAPTVSQLSEHGWVALETVVDSHLIRDLIPKLRERGAEGILEYDLRKIV